MFRFCKKCYVRHTITRILGVSFINCEQTTKLLNQLQRITPKYSYAKIVGKEDSTDVPEKVHFVWMGSVLPKKYISNIRTFRNITSYEVRKIKPFKNVW